MPMISRHGSSAACWVLVSLVIFFVLDASSTRSWLYLVAIAIGPPFALIRLWPRHRTDG